uniref:Uncharacterized protein n=1 Tax=Vespula pensylvanica TaxID=30213 RepID=A0A834P698_VESPE|nr:hypothetical protein H0235_006210 [Vespula pensylvanica]
MENNDGDGSNSGGKGRDKNVGGGGDMDGSGLIPMEVKGGGRCSQTAIMGLDFDVDSRDTCHAKQENPLKICTCTYIYSHKRIRRRTCMEEEKEQDKEEIEVEVEETKRTPNWLVNRVKSFLERHAAANADDDTTRIQAKTGAS